jgi:hypothetical protein
MCKFVGDAEDVELGCHVVSTTVAATVSGDVFP